VLNVCELRRNFNFNAEYSLNISRIFFPDKLRLLNIYYRLTERFYIFVRTNQAKNTPVMSLQQKVNTALYWLYEVKEVKATEILAQVKSSGAKIYQSQLSKAYTIRPDENGAISAKPITTPLGQDKLKVIWDFLKDYLKRVHEVTIVEEGNVLFKDSKGKKVELIKVKGAEKKAVPYENRNYPAAQGN
jgi:hypothetical protein